MEFDKSRVYTSLTADELRAGDKVIVADTITWLKSNINSNKIYELIEVKNEAYSNRFIVDIGLGVGYALAYLVERKENCTNCGEGKWDAQHQKILCDPVHCGNGSVVFRNHEIEVCEYWKPKTKCTNCAKSKNGGRGTCVLEEGYGCDDYEQKADKHTDCNHCEEARKSCAMTNACPNKHYRPFRDTDELVKVWMDGGKYDYKEMPLIWVQRLDKSTGVSQHLITSLNIPILKNGSWFNGVSVEGTSITLEALFRYYEFLDCSPCGVEE